MRLILIHGAPATGKLTVAKAITKATCGRLFDNHTAIDTALAVFDFGEPGFWKLVHTVRLSVLEAAAAQNIPVVVMTYCYSEPEDLPAFEQFENVVEKYKGELLPVYLHCSEEEAIRRVGNADRIARGKTSTEQGLTNFLSKSNMTSVPRDNCVKFNTEFNSPENTARKIMTHFEVGIP